VGSTANDDRGVCVILQEGDTLATLAAAYGTDPFTIIRLNPELYLNSTTENAGTVTFSIALVPGTCIYVPDNSAVQFRGGDAILWPMAQLTPLDRAQSALNAGDRIDIYAQVEQIRLDSGTPQRQVATALVTHGAEVRGILDATGEYVVDIADADAPLVRWLFEHNAAFYYLPSSAP
jgi:hypothetical protein